MASITEQQLRQIVDQFGRSLALFARQWCNSPDDALQEALIELARLSQAPENVAAWLFRVVRNKAMTQSRADRRRDSHQQAAAGLKDDWFESDPTVGLDAEIAVRLIQSLPEIERQVLICRVWGQLSFAEISQLVDRPVANVFRLYKASLRQLRDQLLPNERELDTTPTKK